MARLEVVEQVAAEHPEQPIYAFDVIQRLTIEPTSGYPGMYSGPIRQWAILMDQVENLGMEERRAEYEAVMASIPQEIRDDYLCARERNHAVNRAMIQLAADGVIDFLVLGQDDASEFGPHRSEKIALQQLIDQLGVGDRVEIYPGADVLGALLVGKVIVERLGAAPTVAVEWSRTPGDEWVAHYQDIPYGTLVREYIETLGATQTDDSGASDVLLMANTAGAGSLESFADRIQEEVARGRNVAIGDDAVAGIVDGELRDLLAPRIRYGELGGWSGWNVGIGLTQAVVRSALLQASREPDFHLGKAMAGPALEARQALLLDATAGHTRLLFAELTHTDQFRNFVRNDVRDFALAQGDDPMNMTFVREAANQMAVDRTTPLAETLFAEEFQGTPLQLGSDGSRELTATVASLDALEMGLGWPRYQELDVFSQIGIEAGQPSPAVTAALLPGAVEILPEHATTLELTAVVRNVTATAQQAELSVQVPQGWDAVPSQTVTVDPFGVVDAAVPVSVPPMPVGESAEVTIDVTAGGATVSATTVLTPVWRNIASASEGASATASSWSGTYSPDRAIDGNTMSNGSRWLTAAGASHWLEVRFAEPSAVDTLTLYQYAGYLLNDYTVSVLVDGAWRRVHATVGNTETAPTISFDGVVADGVRLDITATRDGRVRLYELEATCRSWEGCTQ